MYFVRQQLLLEEVRQEFNAGAEEIVDECCLVTCLAKFLIQPGTIGPGTIPPNSYIN